MYVHIVERTFGFVKQSSLIRSAGRQARMRLTAVDVNSPVGAREWLRTRCRFRFRKTQKLSSCHPERSDAESRDLSSCLSLKFVGIDS